MFLFEILFADTQDSGFEMPHGARILLPGLIGISVRYIDYPTVYACLLQQFIPAEERVNDLSVRSIRYDEALGGRCVNLKHCRNTRCLPLEYTLWTRIAVQGTSCPEVDIWREGRGNLRDFEKSLSAIKPKNSM